MSTNIYENDESGIIITRYPGGKHSIRYQINVRDAEKGWGYVQIDSGEMQKILQALKKEFPQKKKKKRATLSGFYGGGYSG